ncbi:hypothetical protein, partial [Bacillus subtilis]|uniref:hypothetical protein n=1 Tax=Bacillus subtilis TaxID=1423 RepID=UPI003C23F56E
TKDYPPVVFSINNNGDVDVDSIINHPWIVNSVISLTAMNTTASQRNKIISNYLKSKIFNKKAEYLYTFE